MSMNLSDQIDKKRVPAHIAMIMDGNGRWAQKKGGERLFGHRNGVESVRQVVEAAGELGVEYLTLYAFSTENWRRPRPEIDGLMTLLTHTIINETKKLNVWLVHFSTDYVFDGEKSSPYEEDDSTSPLSVYGKSKLEGERLIQKNHAKHLIPGKDILVVPASPTQQINI